MRGLRRQLVAEDPSQISESRFSRRLVPSTILATCGLFVRKLIRSPSCLSLALPSVWMTSCLHSNGILHGRERELQCIATEVMQEPGSSSDLLMVQDCTEQHALAISRADLFSITKVPLFALLNWVGSQGCHRSHPPICRLLLVAAFVRCRCCRSPCGLDSQDCTEQHALAISRADLFSITKVPLFALPNWVESQGCHRSHPPMNCLLLVAAFVRRRCCRSPCALDSHFHGCGTSQDFLNLVLPVHPLRQILRHLLVCPATGLPMLFTLAHFVSPFVNDPTLPHQCCKLWTHVSSKCHSTWVPCESCGERTVLVGDDGEFAPIPLRSPPILRHRRH